MKKAVLAVSVLLINGVLFAEELRPQFRAWKSSYIGRGEISNTVMSTSPIIFHCVNGSGTVNSGTSSLFVVNRSTGSNGSATPAFVGTVSTKAIVYLNSAPNENSGLGIPWDVFSDSYTFYRKTGASDVIYLWDFYKEVGFNKFPRD